MEELELYIWGILALSYLIPLVFIKTRKDKAIKKILRESEKFNDIENYIQLKKYEFEGFEKGSIFLMGASITLLLAFKVTNFGGAVAYLILGVGFIGLLSTTINLSNHYRIIMKELYKKKDLLKNE